MQKPNDAPTLTTDGRFDYDLTERVVRQLQESPLHVFAVTVASSLPEALMTGDPYDEHTFLLISLTMVTDGCRGFLVVANEEAEWDVAQEMTELLCMVAPGAEPGRTFVVRGACMSASDPRGGPRTLRLREPARVRETIERAYEEAFAGAGPVDHAAFLAAFAPFGYKVRDERTLREEHADE